jgi:hypothetical protein
MFIAKFARGVVLLATCLSIAACDTPGASVDARNSADRSEGRIDGAFKRFSNASAQRGGGAQVSNGVFVAPVKERSNQSALLPSRVQTPNAIVMVSRDALSLTQIAERLTAITDIEHVASLGSPSVSRASPPAEAGRLLRPNYTGKLSEVLAKISTNFGVEWVFSDGKVIFRDYVTRQYQIPVIPSVATGGSEVGTSTSGYTADFWTEFEASVDGILGEDVVYTISRTTGLLTVTAKVGSHSEIRDFVNEISKNMAQQIAFDVNVLSIVINDDEGAGLDLSVALADLAGGTQTGSSSGRLSESTSGMNLSIVKDGISLQAVVDVLSRQGKVSIDTRTGVTTVNNRPVPVEVIDSISYIASITSETSVDTGTTRLVPQPAIQEVGFSLQLYPRIMNTNEIMVEYSLNLSELKALRSFGEGESQVQLPEVSETSFSQQTVLQNGNTLILSGFERNRKSFDFTNGSKAGKIFGLGSSKEVKEERVATVVMIRPRILSSTRSIGNGSN